MISKSLKEEILLFAERAKKSAYPVLERSFEIGGMPTVLSIELSDIKAAYRVVYDKTREIVKRVLADPQVYGEIDQIVTVGGSTKSSILREFLSGDFKDIPINYSLNPDESVALGSAMYAKRMKFGDESVNILDCLAMNYGVISDGDRLSFILKAGAQIPHSVTRQYLTEKPGQDAVTLQIYQGMSHLPSECTYLGTLEITGMKTAEDVQGYVNITMSVDSNGLLNIKASTQLAGIRSMELLNVVGASKTSSLVVDDKQLDRWKQFAEKQNNPELNLLLQESPLNREAIADKIRELRGDLSSISRKYSATEIEVEDEVYGGQR
jgi:molecular chaperone DnaK (HSP70)